MKMMSGEGALPGTSVVKGLAASPPTDRSPPMLAATMPIARRAASAARRSSVCQAYLHHGISSMSERFETQ